MTKVWDFQLHSYQEQLNEGISEERKKKLMAELKIYCEEIDADYKEVCQTMGIDSGGLEDLSAEAIDWLNENVGSTEKWTYNTLTKKIDIPSDVYYGRISVDDMEELPKEINFGHVKQDFSLRGSNRLRSFRGFPDKIDGKLEINNCNFSDLVGCPTDIGEGIDCSGNGLTSLDGCPEIINGDFSCRNNELETLKNGPKIVKGSFDCSDNKLETLEYGPDEVSLNDDNGIYNASHNELSDLKGFPNVFKGKNVSVNNNKLHSLQGIDPNDNHKSVSCRKNLYSSPLLEQTYQKAREYGSWPAAYLWLITTNRFYQSSKAQREPIRKALSPENIKKHSLAFSKVWKTDLMENPAVKRIMNKATVDDKFKQDATLGADMKDLGF